ncbi:MAG: penicillin-binding transpeptidase domain-containing protein [Desulfohalobiaceae bacterium]
MAKAKNRKHRDWSRIRVSLLWVLFILIWLGLWAKAFQVQILEGRNLASMANRQYWSQDSAYGQRGEIVDRQGRLLAKSLTVQSVFARPQEVEDPAQSAGVLARILDLPEPVVREDLKQDSSFVWIARQIKDMQAFQIQAEGLPGIYLTEERRRFYPQGGLAGQLLGVAGLDNQGLEGLELYFDNYLSGEKKEYMLQRDAAGNLLYAPGQFEADVSGRQLRLTLDSRLQYAAERALAAAVQKHEANSGMSLVVKVQSGEILAWANYPFFNPNNYRSSSPKQRNNRVALKEFEPGSTLKPFLVAAALQEQTCSLNSIFFCEQGKWTRNGFEFNDVKDYGWMPVSKILRYSSNIGAGKLGLELGAQKYYYYLDKLGLGKKTGLPLPSESKGILRPPFAWSQVDLISSSFGQGLSSTALQLAQAYLCLANKGVRIPLRLVQEPTRDPGLERKRVFSSSNAQKVLEVLQDVVQEDGTGVKARIEGVSMAGKTGTSQKAVSDGGYGEEHLSSFVGLLPAKEPQYLILSIVDEPQVHHYGGLVVAPAVREVALEILSHSESLSLGGNEPRGWLPEPDSFPAGDQRYQLESKGVQQERIELKQGQIPDLRGFPLRRAMDILAGEGVMPNIQGRGTVVQEQSPAPGQELVEAEGNWELRLGVEHGRNYSQ